MKLVYEISDIEEALNDFAKKKDITHKIKVAETGGNQFTVNIEESKQNIGVKEQKEDSSLIEKSSKTEEAKPTTATTTNIFGKSVSSIL